MRFKKAVPLLGAGATAVTAHAAAIPTVAEAAPTTPTNPAAQRTANVIDQSSPEFADAQAIADTIAQQDSELFSAATQVADEGGDQGALRQLATADIAAPASLERISAPAPMITSYDGNLPVDLGLAFDSDSLTHTDTTAEVVEVTEDDGVMSLTARVTSEFTYDTVTMLPRGESEEPVENAPFGAVTQLDVQYAYTDGTYEIISLNRSEEYTDPNAIELPETHPEDLPDPDDLGEPTALEPAPEESPEPEVDDDAITTLGYTQYANRSQVAWYARAYSFTPNSSDYPIYGDDCTNFLSQALDYGGWSRHRDGGDLGWQRSTAYWWFSDRTHSHTHTWSVADYMHTYVHRDGPDLSPVAYATQFREGDIAFADWNRDDRMDHAMVVTDVNSKTEEPSFSYHSPNRRNISLSEMEKRQGNFALYGDYVR